MDIANTSYIEFNNNLIEFIEKIRLISNDIYKKKFKKFYLYYRKFIDENNKHEFIDEFIKYISQYIDEINIFDEGLFSNDEEYYPNKPIYIFKYIDFKDFWKTHNLSNESKKNIFTHLQTLYILSTNVLNNTNSSNITEHIQHIQDMLNNLKERKKLEIEHNREHEISDINDMSDEIDFAGIFDLFGEDNCITKMVVEIAKELNFVEEVTRNPIQIFTSIFGNNKSELYNIINKVQSKICDKIKIENLSEEKLLEDALKLKERLGEKLKGLPFGKNIDSLTETLYSYLKNIKDQKAPESSGKAPESSGSATESHENIETLLKTSLESLYEHVRLVDPNFDMNSLFK